MDGYILARQDEDYADKPHGGRVSGIIAHGIQAMADRGTEGRKVTVAETFMRRHCDCRNTATPQRPLPGNLAECIPSLDCAVAAPHRRRGATHTHRMATAGLVEGRLRKRYIRTEELS